MRCGVRRKVPSPVSPACFLCANRLQSKARTEPRDAILLLDLAARQARQPGHTIPDAALKRTPFDGELLTIGESLRLARDKMSQLCAASSPLRWRNSDALALVGVRRR